MITRQKLFDYPMPARPQRLKPGAEYRAQLQRAAIDGVSVKIYTFHKIQDGELTPYFRTFCWDGTFTTWVYDHGEAWSQRQGAVNRWSSAMVDKFVTRHHRYCYDDAYGAAGMLCAAHSGFESWVDGAKLAEQLYQYQLKIRNDALAERQRRVRMDTEQIMAQLGEPPRDLPAFIDAVPLRFSRYVYYKTIGRRKVKGKAVNVIAGYCTHCQKDFEKTVPAGRQMHNRQEKCPCCGAAVTYKSTGKVSKRLQDDARFAVVQRVSHGIIIRGFSVRREYHDHYREPVTRHNEYFRIVMTFSGHLQCYHWEFVPCPGAERWQHRGEMQWRRYGKGGFMFPTDAFLYTKNLRYVLKGTPWEYSGLREFAKNLREPFFIEGYLQSYEDHPCLEYLAKLGLTRLIADHLPGYGYSTMGNFQKTDFTIYDPSVVDLWGKSLREVLPGTDRRDIPLLVRLNADAEVIRLASEERKAGRTPQEADLRAAQAVCRDWDDMRKLCQALPLCPLGKAARYIQAQQAAAGPPPYRTRMVVRDWADYLEMAQAAGWDTASSQVLYPRDLKEAHDRANGQAEIVRNARYDAEIAARAKEYQERFAYTCKGLMIVVPKTAADIIQEGQALHHCVGRYVKDVAKGHTVILFIRRESDPHTPYYTLEVSPDSNTIRQCRGDRNCSPQPDVEKLLNAFKRNRLAVRVATAAS